MKSFQTFANCFKTFTKSVQTIAKNAQTFIQTPSLLIGKKKELKQKPHII